MFLTQNVHSQPIISPRLPRRVAILGATGSIGTATLQVIGELNRHDPLQSWQAWSLSGHRNLSQLERLAQQCEPACQRIVVSDLSLRTQCHDRFAGHSDKLEFGPDALVSAATDANVDTVVAAIVGRAGLESTLAAAEAGKRIALANKETLVVAGPIVTEAAIRTGAELLPVDSEHSAIFQCLQGCSESQSVRKLILTASGGPFRDWTTSQMHEATIEQALNHPTWQMGRKITIDSATMMNKALEIIEAKWLFDVPADSIEVVVHPQSLIHSLVEFSDGSVVAQVSPPDMKLPIQYALTYPRRLPCSAPSLDRRRVCEMTLLPADPERFPALELGFEVARSGGTSGAVVNGANETAVSLFLDGKIRFTDIVPLCRQTLLDHDHESAPTLTRLLELESWARLHAQRLAQCLA